MSSVVRAVTNVVNAVVNVVSAVVNAVVNVVSAVVNFVASPFMGLMGGLGDVPSGAAESQRQDGVLIQKQGSTTNIPVVYGYRQVGGTVIFAETGSSNNQYLWVAYVFSEGPVEGINELWLDDNQLSTTVVQQLNNGQIVDVPDAKYSGRVRYQWFPGTYYSNPADSTIGTTSICKDAPSWASTMVYNGCAVLFARYQWLAITTQAQADANPFSGSIPQVKLSLLGRKVASLRSTGFDGSNNPTGTSGIESYDYQGTGYTERYSTNPAEILLDYLRNPRYGKGLKNTDIDWNSFYTAAAKCNQNIPYSSVISGPCLTLNHVLDTNATLFSNTKALLQNFRGYLPYIQGKYKLKIEDAGNPTNILSGAATIYHTFDKDNIVGDISYTAIDKSSKYNHVAVSWVDPDNKWSVQQTVFPADEATRQTYITQDGGRENNLEMIMSGITNSQIAQDMARLLFNKSRYQESCSFKASAQAMELEPGDNVYIRGNILTFGTTPWRIVSLKINSDYTCDIACVRNPDFIYPYVQANTPDYVAAPYVPVGATIKAPIIGTTAPVGLYPPSRAPYPAGVTPPGPAPTDTTGGGGIGGSTSTQNTTPAIPVPVVPPIVLADYVTIDRVDYVYSGELAYVDLTFRQPTNAQYKSLIIWYKPTSILETVWKQVEATDRPGAGANITYRIGPIIANSTFPTYELKTRVTYVTNEVSTILGNAQLNSTGGVTTYDPSDIQLYVSNGWTLPTTPLPGRRDDTLSVLKSIRTVQVDGNTGTQTLSFRQSLINAPINPDISGVKIAYRKSADAGTSTWTLDALQYFVEKDIEFDLAKYTPGLTTTGTSTQVWLTPYTQIPGVTSSNGNWDLIAKFKYKDGSYSSRQTRLMGFFDSGSASRDSFSYPSPIVENAGDFTYQTLAQAITTGTISNPLNLTIGINTVEAVTVNNAPAIDIYITPPPGASRNYFRGYLVLVRPQNGNGVWTETQLTDPTVSYFRKTSSSITPNCCKATVAIPGWDTGFQLALIPLVYDPVTQTRKTGYNAVFGQVRGIHNRTTAYDYPASSEPGGLGDWSPLFNFTQQVAGAVRQVSVVPPPIAASLTDVVTIREFESRNESPQGSAYSDWYFNGTNWVNPHFYYLKVSTDYIGPIVNLHIYRRHAASIGNPTFPKYYGTGEFEHIVISKATLDANGGQINLRQPTSFWSFRRDLQANTTSGATGLLTDAVINLVPGTGGDAGYRAFYPSSDENDQIFIVVENSLGMSTRAVPLRGAPNSSTRTFGIKNILTINGLPQPISWPEPFESSYDAGWKRKLSEAISPLPAAKIRFASQTPTGFPRTNTVGTGVINPVIDVTPSKGPGII